MKTKPKKLKPQKVAKKAIKSVEKISSVSRLEAILSETEQELASLQPQIEKLEKQTAKLKELKLAKQKLITLKLSVQSILDNFSESKVSIEASPNTSEYLSSSPHFRKASKSLSIPTTDPLGKVFLPEHAFAQADQILRKKTSVNYELFRAVVLQGGKASTEQIKQYLLENRITQPATGQGFEHVELTDISSRINYLVRKGLVSPDGRGHFISNLGWSGQPETC